ncbi:hypothetical protein BJX62DRAFT_181820 [Aspergillus germanicus]
MRSIFNDCGTTLERLELMLVCQREEAMPLGFKPFDFKLLRWKIQIFTEAIAFAKRRNNDGYINMEKLRSDAGWYQVQADHADDRGETGERLLVEIVDTDEHLRHIEELVVAAKEYTAALGRIDLVDRQNKTVAEIAKRDTPSKDIPIRGDPPHSEDSDDDEETESATAKVSVENETTSDDAPADDSLEDVSPQDGPTEGVVAEKASSEGLPTIDEGPEESLLKNGIAEKVSLDGAVSSNAVPDNASLSESSMDSDPSQVVGADTAPTPTETPSHGSSEDGSLSNATVKDALDQSFSAGDVRTPNVSACSKPFEDASPKDAATEGEPAEIIATEESTTPTVSPPNTPSARPSLIALPEDVLSTDASTGVVSTPQALTPASCGQGSASQLFATGTLAVSDTSSLDEATHAMAAIHAALSAFHDVKSFKTEDGKVAYIRGLLKKFGYPSPDARLDNLIRFSLRSVAAKLLVAECFYMTGWPQSSINILQLPLSEFPNDLVTRASVQHILAKAYFAIGNLARAIDNCKLSQATRKKALGHHHPMFLESTELLVHLYRATGRVAEAEDLRRIHFSPDQKAFLAAVDDLDLAFRTSKEAALASMTELLASLKFDDPTPATSLLERLGDFTTWKFDTTVLGFDTQASLLAILADLEDYEIFSLVALRGNIYRNPSPNRTRPVLDAILREAALSGNPIRVQMLLDAGADIEVDYDSLPDWHKVGPEYDSMTPLHIAAKSGHVDVVGILSRAGANKEARDIYNNTPLMLADKNHHVDTVYLLLEHGASID